MATAQSHALASSAASRYRRVVFGLWTRVGERNVALVSAGIAFYAMLAIFPGVAALVSLWSVLSDPAQIEGQLGLIEQFLPDDAFDLLQDQVYRLVGDASSGLGLTGIVSLLVTVWSARLGVGALIQGLNAVHGVPDRSGVGHTLLTLGMTLALMGVAMVSLATVVILPVVLAFLPLGGWAFMALRAANWLVVLMVVLGAVALLYRFGPNMRPRVVWMSPGLWLSVGVWVIASVGFSWYLANFGNYGAVYGSLGAVIALLMWFYISAFAVLLGAALNASLANGSEKPADGVA